MATINTKQPRSDKSEGAWRGIWDFLDKNWQGVAIILAIVAIFVWYQALNLGGTLDGDLNGVTDGVTPAAPTAPTPQTPPASPQTPGTPGQQPTTTPAQPSTPSGSFVQVAKKGQGITHLSRQALDAYLVAQKPQVNLSREHKIYIEDYLKDRIGSRGLAVGEQLTFSQSSVKEAIDASQKLSSSQLANLTKYANRVPSLTAYTPR